MTRRLLIGFLGVTSAVLVLLIVPLGIANQRSERDELTQRIERDAVAAASQADQALAPSTAAATKRAARAVLVKRLAEYTERTDARVVVTDADGMSVVDTDSPEREAQLGREFASRPEIADALRGEVRSGQRDSATLGHPLIYVAVPATSSGQVVGAVRVSYPSEELVERTRAYWTALISIGLLALALSAVIALVVARWIARPLESIAQVARDVGSGDLDARAPEDLGPTEVRDVAARLNSSLSELQRIMDDQRTFTADVSHQLRTPLHALMLRLDNVRRDLELADTDTAISDADSAAAEVHRLAAMVEALLVLERADRDAAGALESVAIGALLRERGAAWEELGARSGVRVELDSATDARIQARAVHVEQVLDNYVDNAVSVSPAGRTVHVRTRVDAATGMLEVHVVDEGPGLDDDQLESVFRRFATSADRPSTERGGFGLGLAIVRRLAEVDGGRAWLRHGPGRGIDAVVSYRMVDETSDTPPPVVDAPLR